MNRSLSLNTIYSGIDSLTMMIFSFVNIGLLTYAYSIDGFGVYAFLMIFSVWGSLVLFDFGIESVLIHQISQHSAHREFHKRKKIASAGYLILAIFGIFTSIVILLLLSAISSNIWPEDEISTYRLSSSIKWVAAAIPFQFVSMAGNGIFLGLNRFDYAKTIGIIFSLLNFLAILYCTSFSLEFYNIFKFLFFLSTLRALIVFLGSTYLLKGLSAINMNLIHDMLELIKSGAYLFLSRIVGFIFNYTDKVLISLFLGATAIGIYEIIRRISGPAQILNTVLVSALLPEVTRMIETQKIEQLAGLIKNIISIVMLLISSASLFIYFISDSFIIFWLGEDLTNGIQNYIYIPLVWIFINVVPSIFNTFALAINEVKRTLIFGLIGAAINLILTIYLIQYFNIMGVLWATLIAHSAIFYCYLFIIKDSSLISIKEIVSIYSRFFIIVTIDYFLIVSVKTLLPQDISLAAYALFLLIMIIPTKVIFIKMYNIKEFNSY